jgi:uncharacterized circularly permuted ATP-grasp superfamily protein/uncharacterized alpha-E superfamily protein
LRRVSGVAASLDRSSTLDTASVQEFVSGYQPLAGVFDELMDPDGRVRPHWQSFVAMLADLGIEEINKRFAAADRYLRDSGVFYRVHEDPDGVERPWPLSHVPLIINAEEWRQLIPGLGQRADLLEAVLADAYGAGDLVREGKLPAALVAGMPEFLRPLVGVAPAGGHMRFYAVDLARAADGRWWVLGDRTQAPSGAGYALESRIALTRAMPDLYRALQVERLAPFFQAIQADLAALNRRDDSRICLLTPGPMNETYFEHAYLARYLGFLLVEGEDLTVREDGVFIRTVSGLRRTEVLVRRLDADFADPLELNARSRLGVGGLVQAVRDGSVVIANALGAGLAEARALLGFLPALAPALTTQQLRIPNVATWWLGDGDSDERDKIMREIDGLVVASAFAGDLARSSDPSEPVGKLDAAARSVLLAAIAQRPVDFVVQAPVRLATMPVWLDGRLQPRPFILRLFLARAGGGWKVMPGGFVRVADEVDARFVSLQHGGRTADAWVLSEGPVAETSLLPAPDRIEIKRTTGSLPSRAADNLFWLGRYVERSEATLRLVRALVTRATEREEGETPTIGRIGALLGAWSAVPTDRPDTRPAAIARTVLQRRDLEGALPRLVGAARSAASVIRDRFSPDAWRALNDLHTALDLSALAQPSESALLEQVNAALRILASFSGLAQENMSQLAGWRFLELGRRIERAIATSRFVRQFAERQSSASALDVLLELCDSQITYRSRYVMVAATAPVVDLVVLEPNNPRSIAYQLDRIEVHLAALPKRNADGRLSPLQQIAVSIATALRTADAATVTHSLVADVEGALMKLSDTIVATYFTPHERFEGAREALA